MHKNHNNHTCNRMSYLENDANITYLQLPVLEQKNHTSWRKNRAQLPCSITSKNGIRKPVFQWKSIVNYDIIISINQTFFLESSTLFQISQQSTLVFFFVVRTGMTKNRCTFY